MKNHPLGAAPAAGALTPKPFIAAVLTFFSLVAIATLLMHVG
jgi:hypothetical protein